MSSSFVIKVPPKKHHSENKWIRFQLLEWTSFALLVTIYCKTVAIFAPYKSCLAIMMSKQPKYILTCWVSTMQVQ
ncbi:hypothetical protein VT06_16655 [Arsukibacterium sp. MJ3]|nr:hypothetical protein VT06_16655 [Arsukibacterium sp. MJ3]